MVFIGLNLLSFTLIAICYIIIYLSVRISSKNVTATYNKKRLEQIEMALRMSFLVGTDFICWMPIIIMGILSLTNTLTIPSIVYVWTAVFVLPINSSLNPYLYTILTRELSRRKANSIKRTKRLDHSASIGATQVSAIPSANSAIRGMIDECLTKSRLLPPIGKSQTDTYKLRHFNRARWRMSDIDSIEKDLRQAVTNLHRIGAFHGAVDEDHILIEKTIGGSHRAYLMVRSKFRPLSIQSGRHVYGRQNMVDIAEDNVMDINDVKLSSVKSGDDDAAEQGHVENDFKQLRTLIEGLRIKSTSTV
ncbi:relaxin receptor 2-like [Amphiura filiformis]|uniref:relaxin receptor 2-like n=1 Tax=Amphiura filiformis TaxID=82378 RepID=UPI003B21D30E